MTANWYPGRSQVQMLPMLRFGRSSAALHSMHGTGGLTAGKVVTHGASMAKVRRRAPGLAADAQGCCWLSSGLIVTVLTLHGSEVLPLTLFSWQSP